MESYNELRHWGIKGQKWGIRRYQNPDGSYTEEGIRRYQKKYPYQNPDGSLTEAGKTNYMKAARKNQLDYKNLSDKDLDMINNRFNKENQYKRNIENYEKSTFKYKAKEALISRIKGNNGGGNGGKKKGKGGGGKENSILTKLLAAPIKKAFEDAFKENGNGGKGSKDDSDESKDKNTPKNAPKNASDSNSSLDRLIGWTINRDLDSIEKNGYAEVGKKALPSLFSHIDDIEENGYSGVHKSWSNMNSSRLDDIEREGWTRHSGLYVISRSDELYHHGIKGQKWGVRRFQNEDGTLTEAGKARIAKTAGYGYLNPLREDRDKGRTTERDKVSKEYSDEYWKAVDKGMPENDPSKRGKQLWDGYKDKYASATLKDLKLNDTPEAREQVKSILKSIDKDYEYNQDKRIDYKDNNQVSDHVHKVHEQFLNAARDENVWRKHELGQDTVGRFVEQKKYKDLVNSVESAVKEARASAVAAANKATTSKESMKNPGYLWADMNRKNVEYWDKFSNAATKYINKNFSGEEKEVAKGVLYWWFIDW